MVTIGKTMASTSDAQRLDEEQVTRSIQQLSIETLLDQSVEQLSTGVFNMTILSLFSHCKIVSLNFKGYGERVTASWLTSGFTASRLTDRLLSPNLYEPRYDGGSHSN